MIDYLGMIIRYLFGTAIVVGLLAFIFKRHAQEWEILASVYGRKWKSPIAVKHLRSMVLYQEGEPARRYTGVVTVGVYPDGIGLKPFRWLFPFHAPVFVPFSDIRGWQQKWYWDSPSIELLFQRTPHLQIIMPKKQLEWISSYDEGEITLSQETSPRENWPWATQAMAVLSLFLFIGTLGLLAYRNL